MAEKLLLTWMCLLPASCLVLCLQESFPRLDRVSPRLGRTLSNTSSGGGGGSAGQQHPQQQHPQPLQQRVPTNTGGGGGSSSSAGFSPGSAGAGGAGSSSGGGGGGGGGVRGREVPASMALMRRPSWGSSRSSAYNQLHGEGSHPGVGYSGVWCATV